MSSEGLDLSIMVSDIFDLSIDDINKYLIKKVSIENREPNFYE